LFKKCCYAHWEADIWKKLRNSRKAAVSFCHLAVEGKILQPLIAEVADLIMN
jgi:hypothetical protein